MTDYSLPPPSLFLEEFPADLLIKKQIASFRQQVDQQKPLLVTGPCSVHSIPSTLAYAKKLKELSIKSPFPIFIRLFIEKSRTAAGWRGFLIDPHHEGFANIPEGLKLSRQLFLEVARMGLPIATEMIDPFLFPYFEDLVSWYFIGARNESAPIYRHIASSLPIPFGFKHGIDGFIPPAVHAIETASHPSSRAGLLPNGKIGIIEGKGNPSCHLVLRGSHSGCNINEETIALTSSLLEEKKLPASILLDCSHGNAPQVEAFRKATSIMATGDYPLMGWMVESFLKPGKQTHRDLDQAHSLTDPCIDLHTLESLVEEASKVLPSHLQVG